MAKQMQIETVQTKSPGKQPKIRRKRFAWLRRDWQLYAMMAIPVIWYLVFCYKPMAGLVIAFQKYNIFKGIKGSQWVGLENFKFVFQMRDFGIALKNTVFYTVVTVPLTLVCSICLALVLNRAVKGAVAFRAIFFFPYVASMVAICVCWNFMLMKDGPINQLLMSIGINFNKSWTADSTMAMWAIILVSVWRSMGYYMVIYLAALQGVPRELYEAATVDGANKWQQFWNITLPQLNPTTFFSSIMLIIGCFKIYDTVAIMTGGGPGRATKMLVTYIYDTAFVQFNYGKASAIAMVLLVIVLLVTVIQFSMEKKFSND